MDNCVFCGAPLRGSWTEHRLGCEIPKMIQEVLEEDKKKEEKK